MKVIVTGASGGAGPGVVESLREKGWEVLPATRREADFRDLTAVERWLATLEGDAEAPFALVHLVGGFAPGSLEKTSPQLWESMLEVNLKTAFVATRALLPHFLQAKKGRIILVAAQSALRPRGGAIAYQTAKAALWSFAQHLAEEVRGKGVTVNVLAPAVIDTPANRQAMEPSPRWIQPRQMAEVIHWLLSPEAAVVHGALIPLEGPKAPKEYPAPALG
ncbi:MAG: SDR family NAD(P)-dependent oxidoreductase [Bacillota bacterium]|nr:SDR family NAD(P)-dependent oxidoreductase [Bacillota bacterium]